MVYRWYIYSSWVYNQFITGGGTTLYPLGRIGLAFGDVLEEKEGKLHMRKDLPGSQAP